MPVLTVGREVRRILRHRPDWLLGTLGNMGIALGTFAFLYLTGVRGPLQLAVPTILTAVADASVTNQLAAEPTWTTSILAAGASPGHLLRIRSRVLLAAEVAFGLIVCGLVVGLTGQSTWLAANLPIIVELPMVPIAVGSLLSVRLPCPSMPLAQRLQLPRTWPRWAASLSVPMALTSVGSAMVFGLAALLERKTRRRMASVTGHHQVVPYWAADNSAHVMVWFVIVPLINLLIWRRAMSAADEASEVRKERLLRLIDRDMELARTCAPLSTWHAFRALPARLLIWRRHPSAEDALPPLSAQLDD